MSRLSELAVAKRSVTLLLAAALFVAGISAWNSLQQELLPDIEFPVISVFAPYPGAGASDVAEQVAKPIEQAISGVPRLQVLQSTSANSIAVVIAQFTFGTDVKETLAAVQQNIDAAGLPASVDPTASAFNLNSSPVIVASIAATSEDGLAAVADIARTEIVPQILAIEGVARADVTGGLEQQVLVTLEPDKLAAANVSSQQVVGVLQANNLTFPGGQLSSDGTKIPVTTIGRFDSVDQIEGLVVGYQTPTSATPGASPTPPSPVTIGELGTVELSGVATTGYARANGNPALSLTVTKTTTANTVDVSEAVEATLDEIGAAHQADLTITTVSDQSSFIKESSEGLLREGGLGALFAVLTIFLFLFSIRATLVAAISIPLSILTALVVMQLFGISLNIMTLGGLAVAVGRVVDDAIVVLENIYRHRSLGEDRLTAVTRGPREVAGAITASTLTTVAVFLPLGFVGGLVSQFFLPFALTVTFALLASLVCALTVVPVLAYLLIGRVSVAVDASGEPVRSRWVRLYTPLVTLALSRRLTKWAVLGVSAFLFFASLTLVSQLPTQFINAGSEKVLAVAVIPPFGATSSSVLDQTTKAEAILLDKQTFPEIELVSSSIPGEGDTSFQTLISAFQGQPPNTATMTVRLDPSVDLAAETVKIDAAMAPIRTDGFDTAVNEAAGFTSNSLAVIVSSQDAALVKQASEAVVAELADEPGITNLKSDLVEATAEIQVRVDPNKAVAVGSTAAQIGAEVRAALTPTTATSASIDAADPLEIIVRIDPEDTTSVEQLRELPVGTIRKVPLGTVATVDQANVQGSITRFDGAPAATISADITSEDTGAVSLSVQQQLDALEASGQIPGGVDVRLAGVTQQQNEAFGGLFASMGVAVLLVYVFMVLTFNSLITPFIILFSLPLATIGAFTALYITGRPIGVSALIGMLMLIGIVVTNAIVLLDLVERLRREGRSTHDALIEGGRIRVRPILMTAIATILALIPLAAGFNQGSIIAAELGTVVIGGLFTSTFLTLLVIPVVYSLVDGGKVGLAAWWSRRRAPSDEPPSAAAPPSPEGEPTTA